MRQHYRTSCSNAEILEQEGLAEDIGAGYGNAISRRRHWEYAVSYLQLLRD
jgi:hypothetical protein